MKIFKGNRILYFILPVIITSILLIYAAFLFRKSYTWVNVANIAFDAIILVYYLVKFAYDVSVDGKQLTINTMFKLYKVPREQLKATVHTSFLTRIITENNSFYILTSPMEGRNLERLMSGFKKGA